MTAMSRFSTMTDSLMGKTRVWTRTLCVALVVFSAGSVFALASDGPTAPPQTQILSAAQARLRAKQYSRVAVSVDNGVATLTGSVDLYAYKVEAEKRVRHASGVSVVRNQIEISCPTISDQALEAKLRTQLAYDRVGYGNVFNAIGLRVENGVAYLSGQARTPYDKDSALTVARFMPGVKDVVDAIEVDPVSGFDDRTRMAVARAVYGYPTLNKYAIDPAKPIRIVVKGGHVELYGMVDSEADKNVAFIQANGVGGVFSVTNHLQVANAKAPRL